MTPQGHWVPVEEIGLCLITPNRTCEASILEGLDPALTREKGGSDKPQAQVHTNAGECSGLTHHSEEG